MDRFDIIISGASYVGLALAKALADALGPRARIALIEKHPKTGPAPPNARAFALSVGSKRMLDVLGVWDLLRDQAQPVTTIEITDSSLDAGVRPVALRFENMLDDGVPASYIVPDTVVDQAMRQIIEQAPSMEIFAPATVAHFKQGPSDTHIQLEDGRKLRTKLLVAADGRYSPIRKQAGIKLVTCDHAQTGLVTRIAHDKPHEGVAVQHFLPAGPFAMLPLVGNSSCITWSEDRERAKQLLESDDKTFLAEIETRVAGRLGTLTLDGPRQAWPLSSQIAREFCGPRLALVGDAAHGVHPIGGQGLNLGLRDVAALAEVTATTWRLGLDIGLDTGNGDGLARYQQWRRFDNTMSSAAFDGLNRLFSNDWTFLRSARIAGLGIVDRIPMLKSAFITEAAGLSGNLPRLLKGQQI